MNTFPANAGNPALRRRRAPPLPGWRGGVRPIRTESSPRHSDCLPPAKYFSAQSWDSLVECPPGKAKSVRRVKSPGDALSNSGCAMQHVRKIPAVRQTNRRDRVCRSEGDRYLLQRVAASDPPSQTIQLNCGANRPAHLDALSTSQKAGLSAGTLFSEPLEPCKSTRGQRSPPCDQAPCNNRLGAIKPKLP